MALTIAQVVQNMSAHFNGVKQPATIGIGLPTLKRKTETITDPETGNPVKVATGGQDAPLDIEIHSGAQNTAIIASFNGDCPGMHSLSAQLVNKDPTQCERGFHKIVAVGFFEETELGSSVKVGEKIERKSVFTCHKFHYQVNGETIYQMDIRRHADPEIAAFLG